MENMIRIPQTPSGGGVPGTADWEETRVKVRPDGEMIEFIYVSVGLQVETSLSGNAVWLMTVLK